MDLHLLLVLRTKLSFQPKEYQQREINCEYPQKNNIIEGRIVHCCKQNKNNHVPASRHAKQCWAGFGRIRARTCVMNGTVGRWEKHTEKRTGSDSTARALPCIPYPWPSECQKALGGIRNKQSFCFVKIQHEERSG